MSENETYECFECGGSMELVEGDVLVCTVCRHSVDIEDYGYEDEYDDYYSSVSDDDDDDMPEGCLACGGPYPKCTISCNLFDE